MNGRARPIGVVSITLLVVALWLWQAPRFASALIGSDSPAAAEACFTLAIFVPMIAAAAVLERIGGVAAFAPGVRFARAAAQGGLMGLIGLSLAVGYAALAGSLVWRGSGGAGVSLAIGILAAAVQVVAEESLFRGVLQPLLIRLVGRAGGIVIGALAFAALHRFATPIGAIGFLNLALGGLLFGLLALRDGGIGGAVAAHGAWNMVEQLGVGLDPNPGTGGFGAVVDLDLVGRASWGGSEAGLNGSWAMAFALAALVVPLALRLRWRQRDQPAEAAMRAASIRSR